MRSIKIKDSKKHQDFIQFFKGLIVLYEEKLLITEQNFLLLRKLKNQANYQEYSRQLKILEKDIELLTKFIKKIDQDAIDAKQFINNSLSLLIKIKNVFVYLEDFYVKNLSQNKIGNTFLFDLLSKIKSHLNLANEYISEVSVDELLKVFDVLINDLIKLKA